jgi:Big-like domain-containing protein
MPPWMRRLSALVNLLAALAVAPAAHAAAPGVNIGRVPTAGDLDDAAALGARYIRVFVSQPFGNSPSMRALYRAATAGARARGMGVVYVLTGDANGGNRPVAPAEFARFAGGFAREIAKAGGAAAYEVWNEEDDPGFWAGAPDAAAYTRLLRKTYPAVKAADRHAKVLMGPLTGNDYPFLEQVYAHGGRGSFDGVGVHTDTACLVNPPSVFYREGSRNVVARFTFLGFRTVHDVMAAHGDGRKPVWMTELGWTTTTSVCARGRWAGLKPSGVSEAAQAANLREAYHCLAGYKWMKAGLWFTLRDETRFNDELNHYGLERVNGARKPSWNAFHSVATQGDTLTGPCGDFTGPKVTIRSPRSGASFVAPLHLSMMATDPQGVTRLTILCDGEKVRSFGIPHVASGRFVATDWHGSADISHGRHRITVIATDTSGNTGRRSVIVTHADERKATKRLRTRVRLGPVALAPARVATVSGRVAWHGSSGLTGSVRVLWQRKRGRHWKNARHGRTSARAPFTLSQALPRPGTWRVKVVYPGVAPYRGSRAVTKPFVAV